jgi:hypothetical protein
MKLMSFLFEDEDQDQNSKGLRRSKEVILSTKDTPIEQVEDALLNLSNYGQYVPYQLKIKPELRSKIATILGPSGTPPVKMRSNEKEWDSKGRDWRLAKAKDIESRTGMDIEGWEDLRYRQLPKEAKNPNVFYAPSTASGIIKATTQLSPKSDILRWENYDDILVFFLDDMIVEDDLVVLADDGEVDIRSTITFNQAIGENESNIQTIPFVSGFDETTRIIFFEYTQFNRFSNPLVIDRIEIVYAILDLGLVSTLVLDQTVMSVIDASAYRPSQSYSVTFLTNESIYYDGIWLTRFNAFNVYDLYYLGGVFLFLLLIGYFSFIYPRRKQKKSLNSNIERTRKVL